MKIHENRPWLISGETPRRRAWVSIPRPSACREQTVMWKNQLGVSVRDFLHVVCLGKERTALLRRDEKNVPEGDQEPGEGCIIKHPMMERCSGEAGCGQPRQVFWEEFCPCKEALRTSSRYLRIVAGGPLRRPGSVHPGRRGTRVGECTARRQPLCPFLQGAGLLQLYWQQWLIL